MLTLFTIPKPMRGHEAIIQANALESWARLGHGIEVFACGDEPGVAELVARLNIRHLPKLELNEFGTPLLSSAFAQVAAQARHPLLAYCNADILLLPDFAKAIAAVKFPRFLLTGQRTDLDVTEPIDFAAPDWATALRSLAQSKGELHAPTGCDYFVFPNQPEMSELPPFVVGRPRWDNWFIHRTLTLRIPVIDATHDVLAIHQNHGYTHVPQARKFKWEGPEGDHNRALAGNTQHCHKITNATWKIENGRTMRAWDVPHLKERLHAWAADHPGAKRLMMSLAKLGRSVRGQQPKG